MIIRIVAPDGSGTPECLLLELQGKVVRAGGGGGGGGSTSEAGGSIESSGWLSPDDAAVFSPSDAGVAPLQLGELHMREGGKAMLQVGNHRILGELIELPQPLAMLRKAEDSSTGGVAYHVAAVVRRKLLFSARPQPIIGGAKAL